MLFGNASERDDRGRSMRRIGGGCGVICASPPRDFDLAATLWDGPVLSEHLRRRYGVDLGVRQCQRLFRQMGFRLRKPRPQVAQSDPLKVAAVKKLRRLARRPGVELWSLDECHFQQHGCLATHNRYFATLPEVLKAVNACFDRWRRPNKVLRRLCCII